MVGYYVTGIHLDDINGLQIFVALNIYPQISLNFMTH